MRKSSKSRGGGQVSSAVGSPGAIRHITAKVYLLLRKCGQAALPFCEWEVLKLFNLRGVE